MPIEGPVRELAPSDLLQLLYLSRRTGCLYARDESSGRDVVLELDNGSLVSATGSNLETRLGRLLVGSGRATDGQIERALSEQRSAPERRIGEILVDSRAVRAAEIERHLRLQVEEAVFDLMRWEDGLLRFEERPGRERRSIEVRLPTDAVLMDAARRLDEWTAVTATAPDPDPLPRLSAPGGAGGPPLTLRSQEWEVLAKVDGTTSLRKIALGLGRSELEVARAIYTLVSAGVVEVGARSAAAVAERPEGVEEAARAVEAALLAGDPVEAERRVNALLLTRGDAPGIHVLRGRVHASKGNWEGAIRSYEQAIELDPLLPTAYFHLARAAVHIGDLRSASTALTTYRRLPDASAARRKAAERMNSGLLQLVGGLEEAKE
jgi:hypothetical protein